jgi:hypothetical protein
MIDATYLKAHRTVFFSASASASASAVAATVIFWL